MTPKLTLLASILFAAGMLIVVWVFLKSVWSISKKRIPSSHLRSILLKRGIIVGAGVILILMGQFIFWINANLTAYIPLDPGTPIGLISFHQPTCSYPMMHLAVNTAVSRRLLPVEIEMRAGAAILEIEVLRFSPLFESFGLKEYCRISNVHLIDPNDQLGADTDVWAVQQNIEPFWKFFDKASGILPIAKASKLMSDPVVFQDGVELSVYTSADRVAMSK